MLREIADRVEHVLVRGRDAAGGGVVVGAEMRGDDAAAAFGDQARQRDAAVGGEHRLRRLDHQLEPAACQAGRCRASIRTRRTPAASAVTCSGAVIFGSVTTKFGGSVPPLRSSSVRQERDRTCGGSGASAPR